jgi:hypothetical protein
MAEPGISLLYDREIKVFVFDLGEFEWIGGVTLGLRLYVNDGP